MFESRGGVLLIAGLAFFGLAFLGNAVVPYLMFRDLKIQTAEELVNQPTIDHLKDLRSRYGESFAKYVGEPPGSPGEQDEWWATKTAGMLRRGRDVYVGEACWHCHSQFVRPVSQEDKRWGPVAKTWEYQNELQMPVLFGTRRVGPDLSREAGRRSSDWHAAHFHRPKSTSPYSVMPEYPWFFDGDPNHPNERGLAIILYMQWLGSWHPTYPYFETYDETLDRPSAASGQPATAASASAQEKAP